MKNTYNFFQNKECEWFPCHSTLNKENFNCLFCFCPLYYIKECGGNYTLINNKIKDCSLCTTPHYNYQKVINKIKEVNDL